MLYDLHRLLYRLRRRQRIFVWMRADGTFQVL